MICIGMKSSHHCVTNLVCGIHFGAHKGFGRVFVANIYTGLNHRLAHFVNHRGGIGGDLLDPGYIGVEYDLALQRGSGIVKVEDHVLAAFDGPQRCGGSGGPRLHQHLHGDVIRNVVVFNQGAEELEFCLRGGGKPTSISLMPMSTSVWNSNSFSSTFIGSIKAWLPSRRSTEHQTGAFCNHVVRPGAVLDGLGDKGDVFFRNLS